MQQSAGTIGDLIVYQMILDGSNRHLAREQSSPTSQSPVKLRIQSTGSNRKNQRVQQLLADTLPLKRRASEPSLASHSRIPIQISETPFVKHLKLQVDQWTSSLAAPQISVSFLGYLQRFPALRSLNIIGELPLWKYPQAKAYAKLEFTEAEVQQVLRSSRSLTRLTLNRVQLDSDALQALSQLIKSYECNIRRLDMRPPWDSYEHNASALEALLNEGLGSNQSLVHLNLSDCSLTDENTQILAQGLQKNKNLMRLDLSRNKFRGNGLRAICSALESNSALQHLDLSLVSIDTSTISTAAPVSRMEPLRRLLSAEVQASCCRNLRKLVLRTSLCDTDAPVLARTIRENRSLTILDISGNHGLSTSAVDPLLAACASHGKLQQIRFGMSCRTGDTVKAELSILRRFIELLDGNPELRMLKYCDWTKLRQVQKQPGIAALHQLLAQKLGSHRSLNEIRLYSCNFEPSFFCTVLEANQNLKAFWLHWVAEDDTEKMELAKLLGAAVRKHKSLKLLTLKNCRLRDEAIAEFANTCLGSGGGKLRTLNLKGNSIGHTGLDALVTALKNNRSITCLKLSDNCLKHDGALIAELLRSNHVLAHLDLSKNQMDDEGMLEIFKAIAHVNTQAVEMRDCQPTAATAAVAKDSRTQSPKNLKRKSLNFGLKFGEVLQQAAAAVKQQQQPQSPNEAAQVLLKDEAESCSGLSVLDLAWNGEIMPETAKSIAQCMNAVSCSLRELDMSTSEWKRDHFSDGYELIKHAARSRGIRVRESLSIWERVWKD